MRLLLLLIMLIPTVATAQFKCTISGKIQYSDQPCAANSRYVGALEDNVSERARIEAEVLRRHQKVQRNDIERREDENFRAQQRAIERQAAAEASAEQARRSRCSNLENDMKQNQRSVARYQEFGWKSSLSQQENELKHNRETYDRECQ
jgi:hypothetical protein